jgi:hypothetical protein
MNFFFDKPLLGPGFVDSVSRHIPPWGKLSYPVHANSTNSAARACQLGGFRDFDRHRATRAVSFVTFPS